MYCMCVTWPHTIIVPMVFYDVLYFSSAICSSFTGPIACSWPKRCKLIPGQMNALYSAPCMILLNGKKRGDLDLHQALVRDKYLQRDLECF